jgi:hypothetical protein
LPFAAPPEGHAPALPRLRDTPPAPGFGVHVC